MKHMEVVNKGTEANYKNFKTVSVKGWMEMNEQKLNKNMENVHRNL